MRPGLARVVVAALAVSLLAACNGNGGGDEAGRSTTTGAREPAGTTAAPSTGAPTSTGTACPPAGGAGEVNDQFPARMSSLVGRDVRTGVHDCSERFVVELQPSGAPTSPAFPGYRVRYASGPVVLSPQGSEVTLRGDAVLLVSMGSPMRTTDGGGYPGPTDVTPSGDAVIREYRLIEDFEGQSTWAIGLDRQRPFTVTVLDGPPRLVVDIST